MICRFHHFFARIKLYNVLKLLQDSDYDTSMPYLACSRSSEPGGFCFEGFRNLCNSNIGK